MKLQRKKLFTCIAIPLFVGILAAFLTRDSMKNFSLLIKPSWTPPGWLFPVVWTVLYLLMGLSSYLFITSETQNTFALILYGTQLAFNFFWPILFFSLEFYWYAFLWLALLWLLIVETAALFYQSSKTAAYLLLPYLLWVTFAGYLNFAISILN